VARVISGRRTAWLVALVPLLIAIAVLVLVPEGERDARATDTLPSGADSTYAVELADQLPEDEGQVAIVLWTADSGELDQAVQGELAQQAVGLLSQGGDGEGAPQGAGGPPEGAGGGQQSPVVVSEDGTAAFVAVPVTSKSATDNIDKVEELRDQLRSDAPDGVTVQVTGPAGIQADIGQVFDGADATLLLATAGVVALLLLITYRSPFLWLIPLIVVGVADRLSAVVATNVLQ
jgi:RND superfamily putative drug exporter